MEFLQSLQDFEAYALALSLLVGSGFGLPVNEDILLIGAAALTLKGVMEPLPLIGVAWLGLIAADTLVLHWGRRFGRQLLRHHRLARLMPGVRLASMQNTMRRCGPAYLFAVRFMPGLRTALLFAAGSLKTPYRRLFIHDGAATLIELPLLVYGVRYVGGRWEEIVALVQRFQGVVLPIVIVLMLCAWLYSRRRTNRGKPEP